MVHPQAAAPGISMPGNDAVTRRFAAFAGGFTDDALPPVVREHLTIFLLDYLRVASLGQRMPWSGWAVKLAAELGGNGQSTILFSTDRTDPERATFVNTTFSGSIDADDVHVGSMLHPGCIVISAALAVGEARGASGERILAAIAAGYENMIRIGLSLQPSHFRRGFQSTATCGGFGAATAAACLMFEGSDRAERIAETLGLVASFSGGLTQFYHSGSTVKRIHAAHAAGEGVHAALLASAGFSGPADILEGKDGFARAYADGHDFDARAGRDLPRPVLRNRVQLDVVHADAAAGAGRTYCVRQNAGTSTVHDYDVAGRGGVHRADNAVQIIADSASRAQNLGRLRDRDVLILIPIGVIYASHERAPMTENGVYKGSSRSTSRRRRSRSGYSNPWAISCAADRDTTASP
jgi:hypothetical protein